MNAYLELCFEPDEDGPAALDLQALLPEGGRFLFRLWPHEPALLEVPPRSERSFLIYEERPHRPATLRRTTLTVLHGPLDGGDQPPFAMAALPDLVLRWRGAAGLSEGDRARLATPVDPSAWD